MKNVLLLLVLLSFLPIWSDPASLVQHFPEAEEGTSRVVLTLEELPNEEEVLVELLPGQVFQTDLVNVKRMAGKVKEQIVEGWGYTYFVVERGPVITTLMASRPGEESVDRFVSIPGKMIPYNSRTPIVVYLPATMELRYRLWRAGKERSAPSPS